MTREEAIKVLKKIKRVAERARSEDVKAYNMAIKALEQEPKTGHWIRMKAYEKWGCSECSTVFRFTFKDHNYCPNCGAKMEEEE